MVHLCCQVSSEVPADSLPRTSVARCLGVGQVKRRRRGWLPSRRPPPSLIQLRTRSSRDEQTSHSRGQPADSNGDRAAVQLGGSSAPYLRPTVTLRHDSRRLGGHPCLRFLTDVTASVKWPVRLPLSWGFTGLPRFSWLDLAGLADVPRSTLEVFQAVNSCLPTAS